MTVALLSQFVGAGAIAPIYFYVSYVFSSVENFKATDMRLMNSIPYVRSIFPALAATYHIPLVASYAWPSKNPDIRAGWMYLWQLYPIWLSLATSWVLRPLMGRSTTLEDRISEPKRDLPVIRLAVALPMAVGAANWIRVWATVIQGVDPRAMAAIVLPTMNPQRAVDLAQFAREFLRADYALTFGSAAVWLVLLFVDLRRAGMVKWSEALKLLAAVVAATPTVGPGFAVGAAWLVREQILVTRGRKDAATAEVASEGNKMLGAERKKGKAKRK